MFFSAFKKICISSLNLAGRGSNTRFVYKIQIRQQNKKCKKKIRIFFQKTMYDDDFKRDNFATKYNSFNLIFKTITIVVVSILSYSDHSASDSNVFIATVGENLCSPSNLFIQALIQFLIILLSKYVSAYRGALEFPKSENLSPNWSNLSKKAPVSKKIGLKLRSFSRHLTPIKAFFTYIFFLLLSWVFVAYIVVCFGKEIFF